MVESITTKVEAGLEMLTGQQDVPVDKDEAGSDLTTASAEEEKQQQRQQQKQGKEQQFSETQGLKEVGRERKLQQREGSRDKKQDTSEEDFQRLPRQKQQEEQQQQQQKEEEEEEPEQQQGQAEPEQLDSVRTHSCSFRLLF